MFSRTLVRCSERARTPLEGLKTAAAVQSPAPVLVGTVQSHKCYVLLHTKEPPAKYESKLSSPIQRALQLHVMRWGGLVNYSWSAEQAVEDSADAYCATAFSVARGRLQIPRITLENVEKVAEELKAHAEMPAEGSRSMAKDEEIHLYVCTHGARDCRCGDTGGALVSALREEVERRSVSGRVKIGEVGHVGGHKHAANLLAFPHGEWLGLLTPEDAPKVLDAVLAQSAKSFTVNDTPMLLSHWRGRMGLAKEEQIDLFHANLT